MDEKKIKFTKSLFTYGENFGLTEKEVILTLTWFLQNYTPTKDSRKKEKMGVILESDKNLSTQTEEKISRFHTKLVGEILNFINDTPELLETIKEVSEIRQKELKITPDICVNLSLDGMKESIKENQWKPSLDSGLYLGVGGETIAFSM